MVGGLTEQSGISSVGRAIPCQGIGREFEPLIPLQFFPKGKPRLPFSVRVPPNGSGLARFEGWRRRDSKAVMPRIANPVSPVRLRIAPPKKHHAGVAQLVERNLAKVEVTSSSLVTRSIKSVRTDVRPQGRTTCGISSVGRAIPCQGIGREFEPLIPLQTSREIR